MQTPNSLSSLVAQPQYADVVQDLLACLKAGLKDNLHSVYIYGSVAQGRAIPGVSNLDVVVVTRQSFSDSRTSLFNSINWRFQKEFPFVRGISIRTALVKQVASLDALFTWGFLLKQCCMNVYGENLAECFGEYIPSWEISKQWNMDIAESAINLRSEIAQATTEDQMLMAQRQMAKKLLRAAYGLVLHKHKKWIDEPKECGLQFLNYFPKRQQTVERLGILLGNRVIPKRSVVGILDEFGTWIANEYEKTEFKIG